jgi:hypothetical protein
LVRRTGAARASFARLLVRWHQVAPSPPPSRVVARDPGWAGYDWSAADAHVRRLEGSGVAPLVGVLSAPRWAEGPGRPSESSAPRGSWKPSPGALGDFATALARRYSGRHPDPLRPGLNLPRARHFQVWNEPNLWLYVSPQWVRRSGRLVPFSPGHYRRMLNAFYGAVKRLSRSNFVVTSGTAPFGDLRKGGRRIAPAAFVRSLLCVKGRARPRATRCTRSPARFDALAHHPFSLGGPRRRALNPDDVSVPDLRKLTRPLRTAVRAGTARPRRSKQLWVTELFFDSAPDPNGFSQPTHARFLAGAFNILWRQGADVAMWLQLRDQARGRGYEFTLQSGLYEHGTTVFDDRPKPALTAFRFPFTAYRSRGRAAPLGGRAEGWPRGDRGLPRRHVAAGCHRPGRPRPDLFPPSANRAGHVAARENGD